MPEDVLSLYGRALECAFGVIHRRR
jgi:hypothetical protein